MVFNTLSTLCPLDFDLRIQATSSNLRLLNILDKTIFLSVVGYLRVSECRLEANRAPAFYQNDRPNGIGITPMSRSAQPQHGATSHVCMDGQKVGNIVTKHQSWELIRPQTGISDFDSRMHPCLPAERVAGNRISQRPLEKSTRRCASARLVRESRVQERNRGNQRESRNRPAGR